MAERLESVKAALVDWKELKPMSREIDLPDIAIFGSSPAHSIFTRDAILRVTKKKGRA